MDAKKPNETSPDQSNAGNEDTSAEELVDERVSLHQDERLHRAIDEAEDAAVAQQEAEDAGAAQRETGQA